MMYDSVLIGGGVVGLSMAWQLARRGERVAVLDQQEIGRGASWAGAGIIPPANRRTAHHPYDQLRGLSDELHQVWSDELQALTGIDTGYRRCGGLYLARTAGETAALIGFAGELVAEEVAVEKIPLAELKAWEPALADPAELRVAYFLPGEAQLRNPRHLQALAAACVHEGVELLPQHEVTGHVREGKLLTAVQTPHGLITGEQFCFTAGSWTGRLLAELATPTGILPIRGQMILYRCPAPPLKHILNEGSRYIVPRDDGHVLVGSTEEEAGFDISTTDEMLADLRQFAGELVPCLATAEIIRSWAGLRPGSFDGLPYLGRLPNWSNAFVAAGHFRSGLYLSPATAVVMTQLLCGESPEIDLQPFRVGR